MMLRDLGGEKTANFDLQIASKSKKSHSKKEACCEEAPEGILDGKMADSRSGGDGGRPAGRGGERDG